MKNIATFLSVLVMGGGAIWSCKPSNQTTSNSNTSSGAKPVTVANQSNVMDNLAAGFTTLFATADTSDPETKRAPRTTTTVKSGGSIKEQASGMDAALPLNPEVRTGTLPNGMRYYIQHNAKPEKRVELRLAVNAGAMQEDDDQRGLAHFVEHMAFNGTTNFKKNELVSFLENTGVRFGADLNAYTSFDETVYMLQLPTDKAGLVAKGLLVMQDWATGIAFEDAEIDKERGVIESEWRTGLGADERMRMAYWGKLFYQSRYADRLPIGEMEVIRKAPYERFRTFYKDWYRPNLMALVVVGDVNLDEIEQKIKTDFAKLQNPAKPREKKTYEVADHKETFIAIATDKEASNIDLEIIYKHHPTTTETLDDFREKLMHELYNNMLSERFSEIAQSKDAPFLRAGGGYGNLVRSKDAYFASAAPKETGILRSLEIVLTEHARILQHGFTASELDRQKLSLLKSAEKRFNERDKTTSSDLAMEYVYHFLQNEPAMSAEKSLQLTKEFLPSIKLEEINQLAKSWITEKNRTVILTAPQKAEIKMPTEVEIQAILDKYTNVQTEPYKDKFLDMPLIAKEPTAGKVVSQKKFSDSLGVTELKLSNGVRVVVKPTKFQNDQILVQAFSPGGHSLYANTDFWTASNAATIIDESGVGSFDNIALEKKLTGKIVNISPYINELYEGFVGNSSVEDFETMLQLTYLYATNPRKDKDAFDRFISQAKEQVKNLGSNPMYYFYDQMVKAQTGNHARRFALPPVEGYDKINFERAFQIYRERFSDFSDFTFVFVGNIDLEKAKPAIEKYLGSLPSKKRVERWKDVGVKTPTKAITNNLKKGIAPQSNVAISFLKDETWTREKEYKLNSMERVLNIMVRENLREDKGGVYSPYVGADFDREPHGQSSVLVIFQCAPENVEKLIAAVKEEIKKLQTEGVSDDNFNKIREIQRREFESNLEKNEFWRAAIISAYKQKGNLQPTIEYNKLIDALTKDDIKAAANTYIDLNKAIIVTVNPEKESTDK